MADSNAQTSRKWHDRLYRSSYFFGAVLLHFMVFLLVATWIIFPPVVPPTPDFKQAYLPPAAAPPPPPPPPSPPTPQVSTQSFAAPTAIATPSPTASFSVPLPDLNPATATPTNVPQTIKPVAVSKSNSLSPARLSKIAETEQSWQRTRDNILESNSDPRNVVAKFPVYLASYADGDWACNVDRDGAGNIVSGSLPNLVAKINEWSHGNIKGEVVGTPLAIGGPDLLTKKPPFIFFTGHKDFVLTDKEIQNLQAYLQIGGAIWGDNALAGRGSRFDVAFRREMKRVVPDVDKNFEPFPLTGDIFTKSWFPISKLPTGMNYYAEPIEHLDLDGKLAILYTPNDYSDQMTMLILAGDTAMGPITRLPSDPVRLVTNGGFFYHRNVFFRNYEFGSCLATQQLGMNIIGFMLVRFDKDLLLAP